MCLRKAYLELVWGMFRCFKSSGVAYRYCKARYNPKINVCGGDRRLGKNAYPKSVEPLNAKVLGAPVPTGPIPRVRGFYDHRVSFPRVQIISALLWSVPIPRVQVSAQVGAVSIPRVQILPAPIRIFPIRLGGGTQR